MVVWVNLLAAILAGCDLLQGAGSVDLRLQLDWRDNRLSILSPLLPGGRVEVLYLEAFCRRGSTGRRWEDTVIPHHTTRIDGAGPAKEVRLRTEVAGHVEVLHRIRARREGVLFELTVRNAGSQYADVEWFQPCIQVASFTGSDQNEYTKQCFLFTDDGLRHLSDLPRAEEALYKGGQVYVPAGVNPEDVNPRPISTVRPANGLIGCFSSDGRWILATAWDRTQELFQGVLVCIHADPRIGGLQPGETKRLKGCIYLIPNDVSLLTRLYRRDFPRGSFGSNAVRSR
ncbi:MAG: hypothetical protein ACP5VE_07855 [Chthonomonadales bacterium]